MRREILDVDLDNFRLLPKACLGTVFWEIDDYAPGIDTWFEKEEWYSSTLLEWGRCGKLVIEGGESVAMAQYAPATLFPRLIHFPAAAATSSDAAYLAYCFAEEGHRGRGLGTELVRAVARDVVERGYEALEAIGDREWDGSWVLPAPFLVSNGFTVVREDPRYPLMRLDLRETAAPLRVLEAAAVDVYAVE